MFQLHRAFGPVRMGAVPDEVTGDNHRDAACGPGHEHPEHPGCRPSRRLHMGDPGGQDTLVVTGVSVTFGGLAALADVSMDGGRGEVVGVIGPNGAGKTTLFNVICGFVRPSRGTISYKDKELRRHNPHDLARLGIARTLQGVGLWRGLNIVENVMAGGHSAQKADFASALFGLWRSSREEDASEAPEHRGTRRAQDRPVRQVVSPGASLRDSEACFAGEGTGGRTDDAAARRACERSVLG